MAVHPLIVAEYLKRRRARASVGVEGLDLEQRIASLYDDVHAKARACLEDESSQVAGFTTRRSGKSRGAIRKLARVASTVRHGRIFYVNETRAECERIAWIGNERDGLLAVNEDFGLGGVPNHTKLRLTFPRLGSFIELVGADDEAGVRKLLGTAPHLLIVDEAQKLRHLRTLLRDVVGAALMDHAGQVVMFGTAVRDHSGFFYEVTKPDSEIEGWSRHVWSVLDNPFFGETVEERDRRSIEEFCKRQGLKRDHPSVRMEWGPEWVKEGARYVYAVHEVPEHELCYAEPRIRPDGLPDLPAALEDLPPLPRGDAWHYTLSCDLGFFPDPFAWVLWAWSWKAEKLYEVASWKKVRLDADEQLAELRWVADQVDVEITVGDIGGAMTPTGKGWSKRWQERYGRPMIEAEKSRKFEHQELFNTDVRRRRIALRRGGEIHKEMQAVLWLPAPADELVVRKLREDPRIPNDVSDAALYGHRHTMQHLAREPEPKPARGTPAFQQLLEDKLEDEETNEDEDLSDGYYSIQH